MRPKRGVNSRPHILRTVGGIPTKPGGLKTFRERSAQHIFLVPIRDIKPGAMGEDEAQDVEKWGKV